MSRIKKLDWIETGHQHPKTDADAVSYFIKSDENDSTAESMVTEYHFDRLPELRKLLSEKLSGKLTDREILMASRETFASKPKEEEIERDNSDRDIVDFIYEM